jgi:hypothetical protein
MKVRKVPLKRRGLFDADGTELPILSEEDEETADAAEDPAVEPTLNTLRGILLRDRAAQRV